MAIYKKIEKYVPGTYVKKRPAAAELAEQFILEWEKKRLGMKRNDRWQETIPPTICFSRRIGVGALEVGDLLAEKTGFRVVDREIMEYIAEKGGLTEKTVSIFDERYPGKLKEFLISAFGEKSFIQSDYSRHLFSAVFAIAGFGPTIFVGRGAHLILPRERVLAIRFIASKMYRIKRLAMIMDISDEDAEKELEQHDKEQGDFFRKVYGRSGLTSEDFDLVINLEYLQDPNWAAEIALLAFRKKFSTE